MKTKKTSELNEAQKVILSVLRRNPGSYMRKTINHNGTEKYKVFDKNKCAIAWAAVNDVHHLDQANYLSFDPGTNTYSINPKKIEEWKAKHLR